MEYATIKVERFRSPKGTATCCQDFLSGKMCRFIGSQKFGAVWVCTLGDRVPVSSGDTGYLIPHKRCEVWADERAK